ncbi:MAG: ATP-binding protein [Acidobacteriota bacterium]
MLIEARIANHRSICDEQILSLEAASPAAADDPTARSIEGLKRPMLPAAAIYGANASGKSNVLLGLDFMRTAVLESHKSWDPHGTVPRHAFAWGPGRQSVSLFEVMIWQRGVRYQYGFTASDGAFEEEWLYAWPHQRKQVWFEREGQAFHFGDKLQGENRLIQQVVRPNALFVSAAVQLDQRQLDPVFEWFKTTHITVGGSVSEDSLLASPHWQALENTLIGLEEATDYRLREERFRRVLELLKSADFGIVDMRAHERPGFPRTALQLQHQQDAETSWLDLEHESSGTRNLLRLAPIILDALEGGTVVLLDELESSLHPALATQIVQLFNDPATNPRNAQLIFTTHGTHLLGTLSGDPALRRDQVWLTEKDSSGATKLYPLTDYRPRKAENLQRGYLQGRYGAVPFLGDLTR